MISSGFTGLQFGTAYAAGNASLSKAPLQPARAYARVTSSSAQTRGAGRYRFQAIEAPTNKARIILRRPRRDTVPLWTPALNASDIPRQTPFIPPSDIFIKPKLSATHRRAHDLLISAYTEIFQCNEIAAEAILQRFDAELYKAWRDVSRIGEIDWLPGQNPGRPYAMAYGASSFTLRLKASPHISDDDALALAKLHLLSRTTFLLEDHHRYVLYQGVLERGLHWIDPNKARVRHLSATDILQLVYHHRRPALDSPAALAEVLQRERSVLIDEAALIYFHTQADPADIDPDARIDIIRQQYANTLAREWLDASLGMRILPSSPVGLNCYRFWFDGKSIPNSYGKSLEQMVSEAFAAPPCTDEGESLEKLKHNAGLSRHLFGQPESPIARENWEELVLSIGGQPGERFPYIYRPGTIGIDGWRIDRDELYRLFEKTIESVGLDTVYPAGTPHYEMAATLRQLGFAHRVVLEDFNNPAELMTAFNRLQEAWRENPRSPVSPAFLTGINLARRNNVFLYDTQSRLSREQQVLNQVYRQVLPALLRAGIDSHADMRYWHQLVNNSGKSEYEIFVDLATSQMIERLPVYQNIVHTVEALRAAPETIAYAGTADLAVRIHDYFHQHLLAHAAAPEYDEEHVVNRILREKLGMTDADLRTKRYVTLGSPSLAGNPLHLLPFEEFLARSQLPSRKMQHKDAYIIPAIEWKTAQTASIHKLARHPVIVAKSRDLLRKRAMPYNETDVDFVAAAQASNIVSPPIDIEPEPPPLTIGDWHTFLDRLFGSPTLTAIVQAFASGDPRRIAELFPFVIPIFDIAEGLRKGNLDLALEGLIHLGVDALFTLAGAGMEAAMARSVARATKAMQLARAATPLTERIAVDSLRNLGDIVPQFSETRLDDLPQIIEHDAFHVHAGGAASMRTVPKAIEAAGGPPGGLPRQIHHLDVAGESVVATPTAHGYAEINHRGELVPGAPPIFTDPNSGEHFRLTREFGLPGGIAGVTEAELAARESVSAIAEYWSTVDVPSARIASPEPLDIIRSLIQPNAHPQHAVLEKLLVDAYTRSETARVIINDAFARTPYDRRRCVIFYDAPRAHQYENTVEFMSDKALFQLSYTGPAGDVTFQVEREMLHEMYHFFTKLKDVPPHKAHNERGPITTFVDLTMIEMLDKPPYPPRLCYRKQGTFKLVRHSDGSVSTNSLILRQLHDLSIAENLVVDKLLNQGREFPATMYAMGQKITERATVRQGLELAAHLSQKARKLSKGSIAKIIPIIFDSFNLPTDRYKVILKNFLDHSKTFQRLAVAWEDKSRHTPVKISLMPDDSSLTRHAQRQRVSHIISLAADRIWLNRSPLYYFSATDTTELSEERALLDALLDLFINAIVPGLEEIPLNKASDCGISVLLSNAIMRQMAEGRPLITVEPDRICAVLTSDPDAYMSKQSALTRALYSERGFLFKVNKLTKTSSLDEEEAAELRQCAAEQGPRYSLFSCLGVGG